MNTEQITELRRLLAEATDRPWVSPEYGPGYVRTDAKNRLACAAVNALPGLLDTADRVEALEAELAEAKFDLRDFEVRNWG